MDYVLSRKQLNRPGFNLGFSCWQNLLGLWFWKERKDYFFICGNPTLNYFETNQTFLPSKTANRCNISSSCSSPQDRSHASAHMRLPIILRLLQTSQDRVYMEHPIKITVDTGVAGGPVIYSANKEYTCCKVHSFFQYFDNCSILLVFITMCIFFLECGNISFLLDW